MEASTVIGLLGALGLGSGVTAWVNYAFNLRKEERTRKFEEKKEAYNGLLQAAFELETVPETSPKIYGYWHNRALLVGCPDVIKFSQARIEAKPFTPECQEIWSKLLQAMREDLGIDKRKL